MKTLVAATLFTMTFSVLAGKAITLKPSGDTSGVIDQQNIQAALDNATGKNAKIKFNKGTFYVRGGVSAEHFTGSLQGQGNQKTTITAVGQGDPIKRNSVFLFTDSHFKMSKLTIEVPADTSYIDSSPGLGISDGGAAIDIIGGGAELKKIKIVSPGPFLNFGEESLETGILVSGCDGSVEISNSEFEGIKRAVIFNPVFLSDCDLDIQNSTFSASRGAIFALGGAPEAINDSIVIKNNIFTNTLVGEMFFGNGVQYPISVVSNTFSNDVALRNPSLFIRNVSGKLTVDKNTFLTDNVAPVILLIDVTGGALISGNKINGESISQFGSIAIIESDNVTITKNNFLKNTGIPGFNLADTVGVGAYEISFSTDITITDELHTRSNLENCQVLNFPAIDTSNTISEDLIQCVFGE